MGLDVTAYSKLKLIETLPDVEDWEDKYPWGEKPETVFIYEDYIQETWAFSEWATGLVPNGVYRVDGESFGFRAGSYSGYNHWRAWLCQTILSVSPQAVWENSTEFEDKPFYRLICFSDCEGYISSAIAKQLLIDFETYQSQIDSLDCDPYFKEKYVKLAADDGLVDFH